MKIKQNLKPVYVRVSHYDSVTKKQTYVDSFTTYDSDPKRIAKIVKRSLEHDANGK